MLDLSLNNRPDYIEAQHTYAVLQLSGVCIIRENVSFGAEPTLDAVTVP